MNKFLPGGSSKKSSSPELQAKIRIKKQELKALKTELKTTAVPQKEAIQAKMKALNKELKIIAPKGATW